MRKRVKAWCDLTGRRPDECDDVLICSLTKAAAAEIRGRDGLFIPDEQIATLHSHCLRALGIPRAKLCVDKKTLSDWNAECDPQWRLSFGDRSAREFEDSWETGGKTRGDRMVENYSRIRCRLIARERWTEEMKAFVDDYERWKGAHGFFDFEDLIDKCYREKVMPPGNPRTIMLDEGQDSSLAELRLLRQWAQHVDKLIIVGDPAQNLYEWRGTDPHGFYASEIPDGHTKVLEQSYRVPREVHRAAVKMIERSSTYKQVSYLPREAGGECEHAVYSIREDLDALLEKVEEVLAADDTSTVMLLYACEFMTRPACEALRCAGIPYWNPYCLDRNSFNPLHPQRGRSLLDRVGSFLLPREDVWGAKARFWNWSDLADWVKVVSADSFLKHGAKAQIERNAVDRPKEEVPPDDLREMIISAEALEAMSELSLSWLGRHLLQASTSRWDYIQDIATLRGEKSLTSSPRVIVGTIHSVKGGQADHVFVCPDLSQSGWDSFANQAKRDSIYRMFYVAMTRAYRRLVLTAPSSPRAVNWEGCDEI